MILNIPIEKVIPNPWQTRQAVDDEHIRDLADDIFKNGLMQTPVGRLVYRSDGQLVDWSNDLIQQAQQPNTCVQLAFGHNRLAAFRWLAAGNPNNPGFTAFPVEIRILSDETMAVMAWSENEKRRDHTPIERARAIQRRLSDFGWSHDQIAEKLGVSRSTVSNALRLLKLPADLQDDLQHTRLTERQAVALLPLFDLDPQLVQAHNFADSIDVIVGLAREGYSSEDLRTRVSQAVDWFNRLVQPALIEPPAPAPEPPEPEEPLTTWPPHDESEPEPEPESQPEEEPDTTPAFVPVPPPPAPRPAPTPTPQPRPAPPMPVLPPTPPPAPPSPPPDWPHSTLAITITLLAEDGHPDGRPAMVGLRANNSGAPLMRMCRADELGLADGVIRSMLVEIQDQIEGE